MMAIDTPARIAIVGAGPIGLETTLYARFLGYDVLLYDVGQICDSLLGWRDVTLFQRFGELSSPLGRSAILTQEPEHQFPASDAFVTVGEWYDRYLLPLSRVDLVIDSLRPNVEVTQIGRESYRRVDVIPYDDRFDELLLVRLRQADGTEDWQESDIVIDASGTFRDPAGWGLGGLQPIGAHLLTRTPNPSSSLQLGATDVLQRYVRTINEQERQAWQGKRLLVIGAGDSATYQLAELLRLQEQAPDTIIEWVVRSAEEESLGDRIAVSGNDSPQRASMMRRVDQAVANGQIHRLSGLQVAAVRPSDDGWWFDLVGQAPNCVKADFVFALTGYRGDPTILRELQLDLSPVTEGPLNWTNYLLTEAGSKAEIGDTEPNPLVTKEPNFYVVGSKSFGRASGFSYRIGLDQIRALFALIADRPGLDLYRQHPLVNS